MSAQRMKFVLVIPDGAGDTYRVLGKSPLAIARIPYTDFLAREGVSGVMQTLYPDLPKDSVVAQLGMLGWDPRKYFPHGRAAFELLALEHAYLNQGDLAFRANLVIVDNDMLISYNGNFINSDKAGPLIERLNADLRDEFPNFELYHNSDFRNTLVVRGAGVDPQLLRCYEPHECEGHSLDMENLVSSKNSGSRQLASRVNLYLKRVGHMLKGEQANMLIPWSASRELVMPPFSENLGREVRAAIVGCMDFLNGIARAGGLEFFKVGNGRPDTDYKAKGETSVKLLSDGYEFVVCHINAPDEASHMADVKAKIAALESIDSFIIRPIVEYFLENPDDLGCVMYVPDHYSNNPTEGALSRRAASHSSHPVPFALWNGRDRDDVRFYSEDDALEGRYGRETLSHLDLLSMIGLRGIQV